MAWKGKSRMSHTPWYTNMASGKCIKLFSFSYNQEGIHLHIHTYFCLVTFRCLVWRTGGFFRRQYKFTISKTQWKMNMKLREKRNEVMSDDAQNIYIYIIYIIIHIQLYNSSIHLWVMPLHDVCLFAICEILEDILWYSGSSIIDLPVLNQHFCSPSSLPQTCDEKAAGLPRFPSHINIKVLCSPRKWGIHNVRRKWNAVVWCFDKWTPASTVQFRATFHFLHFPKNSCSTSRRKLTKITNSA